MVEPQHIYPPVVQDNSTTGKEMNMDTHNPDKGQMHWHVFLLLLQVAILVLLIITVHTPLIWFWSTMSFVPPVVLVLYCPRRNVIFLSLILLFCSQHLIYPVSQPDYAFSYGGDTINDFHVASVLYGNTHFDFGTIGYGERSQQYSDYPMVHLFAVMTAKVTGISLYNTCRFVIPLVSAGFVSFSFFMITQEYTSVRKGGLVTIVYGSLFYLGFNHGQFTRETFAFPLAFLSLLYFLKMQKSKSKLKLFSIFAVFFFVTGLSHHFTFYMLVVLVGLLFISGVKRSKIVISKWMLVIIAVAVVFILIWRSDYIIFHVRTTMTHLSNAFSSLLEGSPSADVMKGYSLWRTSTAVGYFVVICFFSIIGWVTLLKHNHAKILTVFFVLFLVSLVLRVYSPVHPASWGYSLAKRSTVWSFIGLSYLVVAGVHVFKRRFRLKVLTILIVVWLGFSSFAPYPEIVTDKTVEPPITYQRYLSCVWLKDNSIHGRNLIVPSRGYDKEYYEIARTMAPYAYLREYNLTWERFDKFSGYIPVIPGKQIGEDIDLEMDTLYDNGEIKIVIK